MNRERARIDVADRVDQAHDASGAAQVQTRQRLAIGGEMEERVAGQHVLATDEQPVVQGPLLGGRRVQLIPDVGASSGRSQPGEAQLRAVAVRDGLEGVELFDVVACDHDRDLEPVEPGIGQVLHGLDRGRIRSRAADGVVDLRRCTVERDLHVDVVARPSHCARSAVIRLPLVENFTPTWCAVAYSSSSQKSVRTVGSPPPMLT